MKYVSNTTPHRTGAGSGHDFTQGSKFTVKSVINYCFFFFVSNLMGMIISIEVCLFGNSLCQAVPSDTSACRTVSGHPLQLLIMKQFKLMKVTTATVRLFPLNQDRKSTPISRINHSVTVLSFVFLDMNIEIHYCCTPSYCCTWTTYLLFTTLI